MHCKNLVFVQPISLTISVACIPFILITSIKHYVGSANYVNSLYMSIVNECTLSLQYIIIHVGTYNTYCSG